MSRGNQPGSWRHHGRMLGAVGCMLLVLLTGCASGSGGPNVASVANSTGGVASGATDPNAVPTPPPFPSFTVGAWVYNMAPQKGEIDRIYVLTRLHDPSMAGPPQPPPQGSVQVTVVIDGVAQSGTTDKTGYAYFNFPANAPPTTPSVINVTANYQGKSYATTTFYTVLPDIGSPTPGPGTPTATPHP